MKKTNIFLWGLTALMSSCHLYSNYERPEALPTEGLYRDTTAVYAALESADTVSFGNKPWREVFTEPQLQALIQKALENNTDIRTAELTVQQAQAGLQTSRLAFLPQIAFSPQGTISKVESMPNSKTYSIPLQASWQIDAFGNLRNAKKQAEVTLWQTQAAKQATQTAIVAAVANMYYTLQMLDEQLSVTQQTIVLWEKNVAAMESMMEAGMTNGAAVAQAKANLSQIRTTVPTLRLNIRKTENSLCTLLHEAPHPIERAAFSASGFPPDMSAGVPLQLLSTRPDVKAAELQLAYCFYGVNKARSAFYPQITLSGQGGWSNSLGGMIVNPGKFLASGVASLVQPLFMKGQLRANLRVSKLQQEAAQLSFEQSLLNAGQEVSDALASYQAAIEQADNRKVQVEDLTVALERTQDLFRYTSGTSYLETLTAQQSLLQAQLSLISDKFEKVQAAISLYQALGGGREQ